ncbi:decarboxylating NADP(+)-dependent phosphogluconate dehydrogenase [Stratiformator vulcanicus]|uniref:6-phosphogluconate dehydrogenase, decarboxylating n=1 Tax=Stratiformator vulcanicus TaxID=2527980 RepID=A0A517R4P7_9PLAN|nr:decarboxylating NADP(+)-dependent phosphogluconate dehydrogenase [Stratiformator vulcanicus]QDT38854.1 6-phosphogluconate dehydrogenase, NADP(+)-dependent, decarboxylating [Stratiformator vulcanicus]
MSQHDIGLVGLAVMGQNLVLNMANKGFSVGVNNRTTSTMEKFVNGLGDLPEGVVHEGTPDRIAGYETLEELVKNLKSPRRVMLMVKAGPAVDAIADTLVPLLDEGDIIIDGGNADFEDTNRRVPHYREKGIQFLGVGVSGGEEGALKGPSIMPGGSEDAWPHVKDIYQAISAKVEDGSPCCEWVGPDGAGHYVKMVHNGIEYGDMQLICEAYFLMKEALGLSNQEFHEVFKEWDEGTLDSYLIEITKDIFTVKDPETGNYLVDQILDTAKQKGTGKWMSQHALDLGVPTTLVTEAVYARCLSGQKDARVRASTQLPGPAEPLPTIEDKKAFIEDIRQALYASKIVSYAQGYVQLDAAAEEFGWKLNNGDIALLWRGGCIIRSRFLGDIKAAFDKNPELENLLLDDFFKNAIGKAQAGWRNVVATGARLGIPMPAFTAALSYYDGYRRDRLPANLLQAQRDYFGAHTYERIDKPRGETFHTDWIRERTL